MRSSYIENNYGQVFQNLIYSFTPNVCVELGVLDGYSTLHIARGIKKAKEVKNHKSHLYSYDLFHEYPYKHSIRATVREMLKNEEVTAFVDLIHEDAYNAPKEYSDLSVCFLHIDISNTGEVLRRMVDLWYPKLTWGGMIAFEGGSEERDNVEWMLKYNKQKIKPELESNELINRCFEYGTYNQFPSLTILIKKA